jgi:adenylate cyclase
MTGTTPDGSAHDALWLEFLMTGSNDIEKRGRRVFARLPHNPRCKACNVPFEGAGGTIARFLLNRYQSATDPRYCNQCTDFMREHPGGAEVEISMLFADVRGSTTLAEQVPAREFSRIINRFYAEATGVLLKSDAMIDRMIGDEVVGMYLPGIAGPDHAARAVRAAQEILRVTGHADPAGPWIPVGAGVHTGRCYVGTVGAPGGAMDLTALGDVPNVAARLASLAKQGELLASEAALHAAGIDADLHPQRELQLKGRQGMVTAALLRASPAGEQAESVLDHGA